MPDLESNVAAWRKDMLASGMSAEAVAELESHLRDDIGRQIKSGADEAEAFENSARGLGQSAALQKEFKKNHSFRHFIVRSRNAMLSLAGIPTQYAFMNEPSFNVPSRWGTYLRSALFLTPAICLWMLAATYVIPQFHSLWNKASIYNAADFANYLRFDLAVMALFKDNFFFIACFTLLALGLLEWRFKPWPRYRRAVFSTLVFLVNVTILLSFTLVFIGATLAATQFAAHAR